jgi:hypothetical protein
VRDFLGGVLVAAFRHLEKNEQVGRRLGELLVFTDRRLYLRALAQDLARLLRVVPEILLLAFLFELLEPGAKLGQVKDAAREALLAPRGR